MAEFKPGQPNIALTDHPHPSDFLPTSNLDVIDAEATLEQCCDWSFVVELLEDVLAERDSLLQQFRQAMQQNDPTAYHKTAHALKGAALNLHLPAFVDVSRKAELLGKQLEITPTHTELLAMRQIMIDHLIQEYSRLEQYMPEARENAELEQQEEAEEEEADPDVQPEYQEEQQIHSSHPFSAQLSTQPSSTYTSQTGSFSQQSLSTQSSCPQSSQH